MHPQTQQLVTKKENHIVVFSNRSIRKMYQAD